MNFNTSFNIGGQIVIGILQLLLSLLNFLCSCILVYKNFKNVDTIKKHIPDHLLVDLPLIVFFVGFCLYNFCNIFVVEQFYTEAVSIWITSSVFNLISAPFLFISIVGGVFHANHETREVINWIIANNFSMVIILLWVKTYEIETKERNWATIIVDNTLPLCIDFLVHLIMNGFGNTLNEIYTISMKGEEV